MTQMTNDTVVHRIMMAYEIARQATEKPLPKNASEAQDPLDDKDLTQHPTIIKGEMLEDELLSARTIEIISRFVTGKYVSVYS